MLKENLLASIQDFDVVSVRFEGSTNSYEYKCDFPVNVGDKVVVESQGTYKIVTVVDIQPDGELQNPEEIIYKWLVCKVCVEDYAERNKREAFDLQVLMEELAYERKRKAKETMVKMFESSLAASNIIEQYSRGE